MPAERRNVCKAFIWTYLFFTILHLVLTVCLKPSTPDYAYSLSEDKTSYPEDYTYEIVCIPGYTLKGEGRWCAWPPDSGTRPSLSARQQCELSISETNVRGPYFRGYHFSLDTGAMTPPLPANACVWIVVTLSRQCQTSVGHYAAVTCTCSRKALCLKEGQYPWWMLLIGIIGTMLLVVCISPRVAFIFLDERHVAHLKSLKRKKGGLDVDLDEEEDKYVGEPLPSSMDIMEKHYGDDVDMEQLQRAKAGTAF